MYEGSNSLLLDREELSEFGHGMRIFALRFHPDENNIFVTGGWDNQLKVCDIYLLRVGNRDNKISLLEKVINFVYLYQWLHGKCFKRKFVGMI